MPLPEIISPVFESAAQDGEQDESTFYGPYNVLLTYLFPIQEEYMVVPQYKRPTQLTSVDFTTIFLVKHKHHPVFFVEVKSSESLRHISSRREADLQMRERCERLFEYVELQTLYGLDRASRRLDPNAIGGDPRFVIDTASAHYRNLDIMTAEGEEKLREVVRHIKAMSSGL
ncbi:unnamed protein product [Tuber aestivum]|uniref:Uncharacterized protein n=1 Tax=Tuber aestivum TaxID=59557 RepID=A0A292Q0V8_9PEZI|nr:unnamed protein product [Tuber aestivum]